METFSAAGAIICCARLTAALRPACCSMVAILVAFLDAELLPLLSGL